MDAQVPAVVAVVVTTDPGPWFEEALSSLAAQDYEELSVLVLANGEDGTEVTDRVAALLPDAFVRHLPGRPGYGASTNEALGMVEGAAFYLLCHDDVALDPDAVHKLVEESFRSNAGMVSPKFVNWDDPSVLLHVGMGCDKTGAVVDRIVDGEVDHGQHDAVRDVFVAPGGCILVRADLFAELGGFDAGIVAMGEDLDLSWRCQVAGSRVVVAPEARVRHREAVAGGLEPLAVPVEGDPRHPVTMQMLQRRHELRAVLKCYTRLSLVRVLPQAALLALGEMLVAFLARDRDRVRAVRRAWTWNFRRLTELSLLRGELAEHRLFPDSEVRKMQVRGSARLSRYLSRLSHQGLEAANAVAVSREREHAEVAQLTGSVGLAFSEDADFDDLDDLGRRAGRDRFGRRVRTSPLSTGRQRALAVGIAAVIIALGTRDLFFGTLPLVGQLAPLPSWSSTWHHFFSGWQSIGVGTTAPAAPLFGIAGITGTVLFGAMGTLQHVLLLGCIPVGAIGVARFMRPLVSARARSVAVICYLGLPLPYGALGSGRWDGLVAYAAFPFIALRLARASCQPPFEVEPGPRWRSRHLGQVAVLGAIIAAAAGFAPAVVPLVLLAALAWPIGALLVSGRDAGWRVVVVGIEAVAVALLLDAPWVIGTALAGKASVQIFGLPIAGATAPDWGEVIRFAIGPVAQSPLVWLLVAGAAMPLVLGRGVRLQWAARLWVMALGSWVLALAASRGELGHFTPSEPVVLAPAALAVAACIGLGISAFENDLTGRVFGWRQVVSVVAVVFVGVGLLPVAAGAVGGRWGLPSTGAEQPLAFLTRPSTAGVARVLWLGDPRALPVGGWSLEPGLAYALTPEDLPDATQVFTPAGPGPASLAGDAVGLAVSGGTVHLGRLLAPAGVRYVVVVDGIAPATSGSATVTAPPPPGLQRDLLEQDDLQVVPGVLGVQVYENSEYMPVTATRNVGLAPVTEWSYPSAPDIVGWQPALSTLAVGAPAQGLVSAGTLYAGYAPAGSFAYSGPGGTATGRPAFGWAAQYATRAGPARLALSQFPLVPIGVLLEVAAWVALVAAIVGRRQHRRAARHAVVTEEAAAAEAAA
ncbi:MAG TPA: glycosyltransferase family 2 protein [Acidimicrobiales bacterium]|nr:glycosyltransferase family 2 protein [Acidimicrobiales bacterium]